MAVELFAGRFELCVDEGFKHGMFQHRAEILSFLQYLETTLPLGSRLGTVIEIGSHRGGTTAMFLAAGAKVVTIDMPNGPWGGVGENSAQQRDDLLRAQYPGAYFPIWGDSHSPMTKITVMKEVPLESADLLFIDGDHSYLGVREDYLMYYALVRRTGVVAFHDINDTPFHRDRGVVVSDFWKQLEGTDKREFSVGAEWGGIGSLRK